MTASRASRLPSRHLWAGLTVVGLLTIGLTACSPSNGRPCSPNFSGTPSTAEVGGVLTIRASATDCTISFTEDRKLGLTLSVDDTTYYLGAAQADSQGRYTLRARVPSTATAGPADLRYVSGYTVNCPANASCPFGSSARIILTD